VPDQRSGVQLEAERRELQTQVEKLRYRIDLLVASVREGDATSKSRSAQTPTLVLH